MKDRDDLGASHVPAVDWLELSLWTLLTAILFALAAAVIHWAFVPAWRCAMSAKWDELRPKPFTERVVGERLVLIFGVIAFPALAFALGICITILANALR
jgi:hypothetical protein